MLKKLVIETPGMSLKDAQSAIEHSFHLGSMRSYARSVVHGDITTLTEEDRLYEVVRREEVVKVVHHICYELDSGAVIALFLKEENPQEVKCATLQFPFIEGGLAGLYQSDDGKESFYQIVAESTVTLLTLLINLDKHGEFSSQEVEFFAPIMFVSETADEGPTEAQRIPLPWLLEELKLLFKRRLEFETIRAPIHPQKAGVNR
jgi:hypothetical protein